MVSYFEANGEKIEIPGDCSFSFADSWTTQERRSVDGTGTAQSVAFMEKAGRQPGAVQISFSLGSTEGAELFRRWSSFDSLVGVSGSLVYSGRNFGKYIVTDGSFTVSTDGAFGAVAVSVSMNLRENSPNIPGDRDTIKTRFI